jgi:hypothetical protein
MAERMYFREEIRVGMVAADEVLVGYLIAACTALDSRPRATSTFHIYGKRAIVLS